MSLSTGILMTLPFDLLLNKSNLNCDEYLIINFMLPQRYSAKLSCIYAIASSLVLGFILFAGCAAVAEEGAENYFLFAALGL